MSGAIAGGADFLTGVSCRTGPLRVGRSLRDRYNLWWRVKCTGPPVGRNHHLLSRPTGGPKRIVSPRPVYASRSDRPTRSGPVRQDMPVTDQLRPLSLHSYTTTPRSLSVLITVSIFRRTSGRALTGTPCASSTATTRP